MASMVKNFTDKSDKVPMEELIESYRNMKIKKVQEYPSVDEEKILTKPGCAKILITIKDIGNSQFLRYETDMKQNRCRFGEEIASFYIIKIKAHPNQFDQEDYYQIVYSTANPAIHDKYEGDRFDLFNCDFNNKGSLLRITKLDDDSYDIQCLQTGKYLQDFNNKSYGFHQPKICRDKEDRIKWQFGFPKSEEEKLGYEDDENWDDL